MQQRQRPSLMLMRDIVGTMWLMGRAMLAVMMARRVVVQRCSRSTPRMHSLRVVLCMWDGASLWRTMQRMWEQPLWHREVRQLMLVSVLARRRWLMVRARRMLRRRRVWLLVRQ